MTDKLSPRPVQKQNLLGWKELDSILQSVLSEADKDGQHGAVINLSQFSMSKEEITFEAEKNGYKVTDTLSGELVIE